MILTLLAPFQGRKLSKNSRKIADEIRNWESQSDIEASKWSKGMSKDDENACILAKVGGPSPKWSEYMTEEDKNMGTEQDMDTLKMIINDEIVEDDIHPDFK